MRLAFESGDVWARAWQDDWLHAGDDGEAIPEPGSIDAIKTDPELADWARGRLVLIPLLLVRGSVADGSTSLDRGLLHAIDDEAQAAAHGPLGGALLAAAARRGTEAA